LIVVVFPIATVVLVGNCCTWFPKTTQFSSHSASEQFQVRARGDLLDKPSHYFWLLAVVLSVKKHPISHASMKKPLSSFNAKKQMLRRTTPVVARANLKLHPGEHALVGQIPMVSISSWASFMKRVGSPEMQMSLVWLQGLATGNAFSDSMLIVL
jgi:hypothetical protein